MKLKLLLDEQLPVQIAKCFPQEFEVKTVYQMGWSGKADGEIISLASKNNFLVLLSGDKNIQYQQNLKQLTIMIVVFQTVKSCRFKELKPHIPAIIEFLKNN